MSITEYPKWMKRTMPDKHLTAMQQAFQNLKEKMPDANPADMADDLLQTTNDFLAQLPEVAIDAKIELMKDHIAGVENLIASMEDRATRMQNPKRLAELRRLIVDMRKGIEEGKEVVSNLESARSRLH